MIFQSHYLYNTVALIHIVFWKTPPNSISMQMTFLSFAPPSYNWIDTLAIFCHFYKFSPFHYSYSLHSQTKPKIWYSAFFSFFKFRNNIFNKLFVILAGPRTWNYNPIITSPLIIYL